MKMIIYRYGLSIGLFILSASFIVKHYWPQADFADGFMKGLGITLMIVMFIRQRRFSSLK
ncbi:MAG: hypothetical protein JST19_03840 [Bacteroidetes bacterium]|nr:hypothetical protein [Bacteroidota bacterium]